MKFFIFSKEIRKKFVNNLENHREIFILVTEFVEKWSHGTKCFVWMFMRRRFHIILCLKHNSIKSKSSIPMIIFEQKKNSGQSSEILKFWFNRFKQQDNVWIIYPGLFCFLVKEKLQDPFASSSTPFSHSCGGSVKGPAGGPQRRPGHAKIFNSNIFNLNQPVVNQQPERSTSNATPPPPSGNEQDKQDSDSFTV